MITYISGGERSGKSGFAQKMALDLSEKPIYLATAKVWDDSFQERVDRHQSDRDEHWTNIEEQFDLAKILPDNRVVVIDCVTLWLTNFFSQQKSNRDASLDAAKKEFNKLLSYDGHLIFISNEIGMGVHAHNKISRDFVELQGWMNQHIARHANEAYFMVSGLPLKVK